MRIRVSHLKDRKQRRERFAVLTAYDATHGAAARARGRRRAARRRFGRDGGARVRHDAAGDARRDDSSHRRGRARHREGARHRRHAVSHLSDHAVRSGAQRGTSAERRRRGRGESRRRTVGHRRRAAARRCRHSGDGASRGVAAVGESAERIPAARPRSRTRPSSSSTMRSRCRTPARSPSCSRRFPRSSRRRSPSTLDVPTVGIGAGPDCDGQVLVSSDLLGLHDKVPPFAKKYANLADVIVNAARAFVADVQATSLRRSCSNPGELWRDSP